MSSAPQKIPISYIKRYDEAQLIGRKISRHGSIAVDLEGDLRPVGRISLLQIKHRDVGTVIFDIYVCPAILERGIIRDLLQSKNHQKILHDCRHDSNALLGQFKINMVNVLDTQCGHSILMNVPITKRTSLQRVLEYHQKSNPHKESVKHRPGLWEQRPLPGKLLQYAAYDVEHLEYIAKVQLGQLHGEKFDLWVKWSDANRSPFGSSKPIPTPNGFLNYLQTLSEQEIVQCEERLVLVMYFQEWRQTQRTTKGVTLNDCIKSLMKTRKLLVYTLPQTNKKSYVFETTSGRIASRVKLLKSSHQTSSNPPASSSTADSNPVDTFATRKFVERNRGGIDISEPIEFPCTASGAESTVVVSICNTGAKAHMLASVQILGATTRGVFTVHLPSARRVAPKSTMKIPLVFKPSDVGVCRALLSFQFDGFVIGRYICATCGDSDLREFLKPSSPYVKKVKVKRSYGGHKQVMEGENVKFGCPPYPRGMAEHPCRQITAEDIDNLKTLPSDFEELSARHYITKQTMMLAVEERRLEADIQEYNMPTALLRKSGIYLLLAIPGLAEKRPSVLRGDSVLCSLNGVNYKGYVHMVHETDVSLRFHPSFHAKHMSGVRYDIQFIFPRRTMRLLLQGLSFLSPSRSCNMTDIEAFHKMLFPLESVSIPSVNGLNMANSTLNMYQRRAIESILGRIQGNLTTAKDNTVLPNPPYVIFGPPGTGKTSTIVEAVFQASRFKACGNIPLKILVCAPSNTAADVFLTRFSPFMNKSELFRCMAFTRDKKDVSETIHKYCNFDGESNGYTSPSPEKLNTYQVVVATCAMAGKLYNNGMNRHHFDVVVVDECGHAWESEVVTASSFLLKPNGLLVMGGDPMQLGPVTHSDTDLKISMLERLLARPIYVRDMEKFPATGGYDPSCVTKLLETYRCHPEIIKVPNVLFYDNDLRDQSGLEARSLLSWEHLAKPKFPLIFHGVQGENEREGNSPSWFNQSEVEQVLKYIQLLLDHARVLPSDIGIIAPYQKQVKKIQMGLRVRGYDKNIMVGSCEQFQGQEKRVIIISTVRTSKELMAYDSRFHLGFVANFKRMNVAITRAKALLVVVGSPAVLKEDKHWRSLLKHCHDNGACTGVPFSLNDGNDDGTSPDASDGDLSAALSRMQLGDSDDEDFNEPPPYDGGETKEI